VTLPTTPLLAHPGHTNHLAREKSPYLLQHAHTIVDWFAWTATAFETARPPAETHLSSIGYSTCHWCHVMEQESFETSACGISTRLRIHAKGGREERPTWTDLT